MDQIINGVINSTATAIGLTPAALALVLWGVVKAANLTSRAIPDTATGTLGVVRKVASFIGLHISNNTGTAPIAVNGTSDVLIPTATTATLGQAAATLGEVVEEVPVIKDALQKGAAALTAGVQRDPETGKFQPLDTTKES